MKMMKMNRCCNCGAPIEGDVCKYCGTKFHESDKDDDFWRRSYVNDDMTVSLVMPDGEIVKCYIAHIDTEILTGNTGRDMMGMFRKPEAVKKRKFMLVEIL